MRSFWRALSIGVVTVITLWVTPAGAHMGSAAQPYMSGLSATSVGDDTWKVTIRLVDRDSGSPAPGFGVRLSGVGPAGATLSPVTLADEGDGTYRADLAAAIGKWRFSVAVEPVPGGPDGIALRQSADVELTPTGAGSVATPDGSDPATAVHHHNHGTARWVAGLLLVALAAGGFVALRLLVRHRSTGAPKAPSPGLHATARRD